MASGKFQARWVLIAALAAGGPVSGVAVVAQAQTRCPAVTPDGKVHAAEVFADGMVAVEASGVGAFPVNVVLYRGQTKCTRAIVDRYEHEGGVPQVGAVFPYTVHGVRHLFVLVSWRIEHRGIGTSGTLYQIYAYGDDGKGALVRNREIDEANAMSGFEGRSDFERTHFDGKTPAEIKQLVDRLGWN